MKLPGINIVPTKELTKQVRRIADCLEVIVLKEYGVQMTPTPKPDRDESDVLYDDEEKHALQDLRDIGEYKKPSDVVDVEEYPG